MSDEINSSKYLISNSKKKSGGGTAIGGGVNFQAITTAIVAVHILRGTPLGWLDGILDDIPLAVWAESEGPGDDIRIEFKNNVIVEAQVKKGLKRGSKLWDSLEAMAQAIHRNKINYAVLVVASDSSRTIQNELADDIKRLGQGRSDHLTDIGNEWKKRLLKLNISSNSVCSCMRVRVIHGLSHEDTNILFAKETLRHICMDDKDVNNVWDALYRHSVQLIANRGRWELKDILQILSSINIKFRNGKFPGDILNHQAEWVKDNNSYFFITGVRSKILIKHLLPMKVEKVLFNSSQAPDVPTALSNYKKTAELEFSSSLKGYDSVWIGRFIKHAVVLAGPGLGKSTMLKELAHQYAQDGYFVLKVDLKKISVRLKKGESFSDSLISLSLDGSGLILEEVRDIPLRNWVILADGLDECGDTIHDVAQQISHFLKGHPNVRIIITTRPIGYSTAEFESWTHYRLLPPAKEQGAKNLAHLWAVIAKKDSVEGKNEIVAERELRRSHMTEAFANSPQLLGMAAALLNKNQNLPKSRTELYQQLINLFEAIPKEKDCNQQEICDLVINIVGWALIKNPFIELKDLIKECTEIIVTETGQSKYEAPIIVRNSLRHWERLGLIEQVNYQFSSLMTFIHKTFSEFVAARFLRDIHQNYLEEIIDKSEWNEVINFAMGIGLADEVINIKLRRHSSGESGSLQDALSLLYKHSVNISNSVANELIEQAVLVIKRGSEERYILGVALSNLVSVLSETNSQVADILIHTISSWLDMPNELYLIGWGIIVKSADNNFDVELLSNTFKKAKSYITIPSIIQDILKKRDRSDIKLLEHIALATLRSHSDDKIAEFYYSELKGQDFLSVDMLLACRVILKDRGIELEELPFSKLNSSKRLTRTVSPLDSVMTESRNVYYAIAKAIVNSYKDSFEPHRKKGKFPNFAGFLSASGFLEVPVSYVYGFDVKYEEKAFSSLIKSIIELLPLDLYALLNEAIELINIMDNDPSTRVLVLLPRVDILDVEWEKSSNINSNREYLKKMLFHPSKYIVYLTVNFLIHYPFSKDELVSLLTKADGFTLSSIFLLIYEHYPNDFFEMISDYLESHTPKDPTYLFDSLRGISNRPTQRLVENITIRLSSDNNELVVLITDLLSHWVDLGVAMNLAYINRVIDFWQSKKKEKSEIYFNDPLNRLLELKDQMNK